MGKHNEFGKKGEDLAAEHLIKNGYQIMYRNYRYLKAEIDIIAKKGNVLVIVEVKSRSYNHIQSVAEIIPEKKIKLLVKAANHYIISKDLEVEARFDIITVLKKETQFNIDHIQNAFYHF